MLSEYMRTFGGFETVEEIEDKERVEYAAEKLDRLGDGFGVNGKQDNVPLSES